MNLCLCGAHEKQKQVAFPTFPTSFESPSHWVGLPVLFKEIKKFKFYTHKELIYVRQIHPFLGCY
jgi:hypothetical protein